MVPRLGINPTDLRIGYPAPWSVSVSPWPFSVEWIEADIPFRRVPAKNYADIAEFRAEYASAAQEMQMVRVVKSG